MHMGSMYSAVVARLADEVSRLCTHHIRNFPYYLQVNNGGTNEGKTIYSFAWSLDKGGYEIVSKILIEFLPDTCCGCVMVRVQPVRLRPAVEPDWDNHWENPYSEKWRYNNVWTLMSPDPVMIITLLEAHADHDKLIQSVHAE